MYVCWCPFRVNVYVVCIRTYIHTTYIHTYIHTYNVCSMYVCVYVWAVQILVVGALESTGLSDSLIVGVGLICTLECQEMCSLQYAHTRG